MKSKDSMEVKNKMEGGDTMENNVGKFTQEQIDELLQKAKANNGVLTYQDIMTAMQSMPDISSECVEGLYEVLSSKGIELVDDTVIEDVDDVLPVVDDVVDDNDEIEEINEAELANLSVPEGISIDDPVRMYLK